MSDDDRAPPNTAEPTADEPTTPDADRRGRPRPTEDAEPTDEGEPTDEADDDRRRPTSSTRSTEADDDEADERRGPRPGPRPPAAGGARRAHPGGPGRGRGGARRLRADLRRERRRSRVRTTRRRTTRRSPRPADVPGGLPSGRAPTSVGFVPGDRERSLLVRGRGGVASRSACGASDPGLRRRTGAARAGRAAAVALDQLRHQAGPPGPGPTSGRTTVGYSSS